MNQEQANQIKAIIAKDANSTGQLFSGDTKACFVGGLLENMDPTTRDTYKKKSTWFPSQKDVSRLRRKYGITHTELDIGIRVNDHHTRIDRRRRALRDIVQSWVTP